MRHSTLYSVGVFQSMLRPLVRGRHFALLLSLLAVLSSQSVAQDAKSYSEEPAGFRLTDYRTPVPKTLTGATTLSTEELEALIQASQPLLIDVLPKTKQPDWWPENQVWLPEPHVTIPSAYWLPEIGFGTINEQVEIVFKQFMHEMTEDRLDYPVVLFCRENCWISWNAAKRLVGYGYSQVYWFPDGIDGWQGNLNDTEKVELHSF